MSPSPSAEWLGAGVVIADQLRPFQCAITVRLPVLVFRLPTAKQLVALGQVIPTRFPAIELGAGTKDQRCPFQCSIEGLPTAKQLVLVAHATPDRNPQHLMLGIAMIVQELPFQCSANVDL